MHTHTRSLAAICAIAAFAVAAGCASPEKFQQQADSHIGQSEAELVASMGKPTRVAVDPQGYKLVSYTRSNAKDDDGFSTTSYATLMTSLGPAGTAVASKPGQQKGAGEVSCTLTFRLSPSGTVMSWSKNGNLCVD